MPKPEILRQIVKLPIKYKETRLNWCIPLGENMTEGEGEGVVSLFVTYHNRIGVNLLSVQLCLQRLKEPAKLSSLPFSFSVLKIYFLTPLNLDTFEAKLSTIRLFSASRISSAVVDFLPFEPVV